MCRKPTDSSGQWHGFSGSYSENPFNLQHFNCNYITFANNGVSVPGRPLTPQFETTEYNLGLVEAHNRLYKKNIEMSITPSQYLNSSTPFSLDLNDTFNPETFTLEKWSDKAGN